MSAASAEIVSMLPAIWVERIFSKLTVRYGTAFRARYAGVDEQLLRDDWAEQLAGLRHHPEAIAYALNHLPAERAPNVAEFRALCNQAPPRAVAGLLANMPTRRPPPPAVAAKLAEFQARVKGGER
jgi:hypothetical protein